MNDFIKSAGGLEYSYIFSPNLLKEQKLLFLLKIHKSRINRLNLFKNFMNLRTIKSKYQQYISKITNKVVGFFQLKNKKCTPLVSFINPFQANVPFLYTLKTSENQRFSGVFREFRKGTLAWNRLRELLRLNVK